MSIPVQSWNNILSYIKANLGAPINMVELSDEEIINYLKNNTLVEFSQFVPKKKYYLLDETDLVDYRIQEYKIDVEDYILDVTEVYTYQSEIPQTLAGVISTKILDDILFAKFESMLQSVNPVITWKFIQPNYLMFYTRDSIEMYLPCLVEYCTVYEDLSEIPGDMYQIFKKLCLADIKILIGNTRTKYQLSTPFGQIMNNGEVLKQEGMQERQILMDMLNNGIPPDHLVQWVF